VFLFFPGLGTTSKVGFTAMVAHYIAEHTELFSPEVPAVGVAVMQGFDGLPLRTTKLMSTALISTDDAGHIIEHVASKFGVKIVLLGISLGGAFVTHWAGKFPTSCQEANVVGGVIVAHGLDVYHAAKSCDAMLPNQYLLSCYRHNLSQSPPDVDLVAKIPDFDIDSLKTAKSAREWDVACLPLYGFNDYESMLHASDPGRLLGQVSIPLVFVSADNDPIAPASRLVEEGRLHEVVPNCTIVRTKKGSHLAWWEGGIMGCQQPWAVNLIVELSAALLKMPSSEDEDQPARLDKTPSSLSTLRDRILSRSRSLGRSRSNSSPACGS
jgi:predicted alpha/beta-fold hydrolase